MPLRDMRREQAWLLPPCLDELLPLNHAARFVPEFNDTDELHGGWLAGDPQVEGPYEPTATEVLPDGRLRVYSAALDLILE